jgi:hypothetical protein
VKAEYNIKVGDLVKRKDSHWIAIVTEILATPWAEMPSDYRIAIRWVDNNDEDAISASLLEVISEGR